MSQTMGNREVKCVLVLGLGSSRLRRIPKEIESGLDRIFVASHLCPRLGRRTLLMTSSSRRCTVRFHRDGFAFSRLPRTVAHLLRFRARLSEAGFGPRFWRNPALRRFSVGLLGAHACRWRATARVLSGGPVILGLKTVFGI